MQSGLLFTTPVWFVLLCVAAGALYAWFLYSQEAPWSKTINTALALVRGILVALICFLLLGPRVKNIETTTHQATAVLAIDNSSSMKEVAPPLLESFLELEEKLRAEGYQISVVPLSEGDSLRFEEGKTNLSSFLGRIKNQFEGENLTDVILLSDGIVNEGSSPVFGTYPFKIHSVAVGDTIPARDIQITHVRANQVAFLGNQFPIQVDISAFGMRGQRAHVTLRQGNRVLGTKSVNIAEDNFFETIEWMTTSPEKGLQRFTIELNTLPGERTQSNNRRDVYIDIIDGRENILILALSPHPDLKALRSIISLNDNFELDMHILSLGPIPSELLKKKYDLVIFHQLPDLYNLWNNSEVTNLINSEIPAWFIYGGQTSVSVFNRVNKNVMITGGNAQQDRVTGRFNKSFTAVVLDPQRLSRLDRLPPIATPFGEYAVVPGSEIILYQRIGNLDTERPLLSINVGNDGRKTAAFLGDGLWLWRQEEFSQTGKTEVTDELILKLIQLLSIKEDKRKFRVTPADREFNTREPVILLTEVYNDVYEKIYGQEVTLKITNEDNESSTYTYVNTEGQPEFRISGLKEGAYRYTASALINNQMEQVEGRFLVREIDLESINMTADHGMLRQLAAKTGGGFYLENQMPELFQQLKSSKSPDRLSSSEEVVEIIHLKWLFFLLVLLATMEWAVRKYLGQY